MKSIHFDAASTDDICNILEALGFPPSLEEAFDQFLEQLENESLAIVRTDFLNNGLQVHYDSGARLFALMTRNGFQLKLPSGDFELIEVQVFMAREEEFRRVSYRIWIRFSYEAFKEVGKICSMFRDMNHQPFKKAMVSYDKPEGEVFTIKAIAAICACHVAGAHAACAILADMARDNEI